MRIRVDTILSFYMIKKGNTVLFLSTSLKAEHSNPLATIAINLFENDRQSFNSETEVGKSSQTWIEKAPLHMYYFDNSIILTQC